MSKKSKKGTAIKIIIACIVAVVGVKVYLGSSKMDLNTGPQAKIKGESGAPLKIIEFIAI